jgi:hypothetical protein
MFLKRALDVSIQNTSIPVTVSSENTIEGTNGTLSVDDTTGPAAEIKVAGARTGKRVILQAIDGAVYWSYSSAVTAATGIKIEAGDVAIWTTDTLSVPIYVVAATGDTIDCRVAEEVIA